MARPNTESTERSTAAQRAVTREYTLADFIDSAMNGGSSEQFTNILDQHPEFLSTHGVQAIRALISLGSCESGFRYLINRSIENGLFDNIREVLSDLRQDRGDDLVALNSIHRALNENEIDDINDVALAGDTTEG